MGMNDENEIIKLACGTLDCKKSIEGTYKELFGGIPSLILLPKMFCSVCGGEIELTMTGKYKCEIAKPTTSFNPNMAYPQYGSHFKNETISNETISTDGWSRLQAHVLKLKSESSCGGNEAIRKHWDSILAGVLPFSMKIVKEQIDEQKPKSEG